MAKPIIDIYNKNNDLQIICLLIYLFYKKLSIHRTMKKKTTNVLLCGVGGQGVVLASEILAQVAFIEGWDVKKSEIHGLSQLGGGVDSSIRWGHKVYSPIIPEGTVDFLVAFLAEEVTTHAHRINTSTGIIKGTEIEYEKLPHIKCANIYMLGRLAHYIDFKEDNWEKAMAEKLKPKLLEMNLKAFYMGKKKELEGG